MEQDLSLSKPPESYTSLRLLSIMFPDISNVIVHVVEQIYATPSLGFVQKIIHSSISTCTEQRLPYGSQQAGAG
jgi:hypothetical protein